MHLLWSKINAPFPKIFLFLLKLRSIIGCDVLTTYEVKTIGKICYTDFEQNNSL